MYFEKISSMKGDTMYKDFYEFVDRENEYTTENTAKEHYDYGDLNLFIESYKLVNKKCLEIGSGKGIFQDMVVDYTGIDIAQNLGKYYKNGKKYIAIDSKYPFKNEEFDAIWTIAVFEHIPNLDEALLELKRVLKKGGVCYFHPAWQARPWAAEGYPVRNYSEFGIKWKLIKLSIPIRNNLIFRGLYVFPRRLVRKILNWGRVKNRNIKYKKLKPNYEKYWMSDSDACNSIDPYDAILWFESNGFRCLNYKSNFEKFFVRNRAVIFEKQ